MSRAQRVESALLVVALVTVIGVVALPFSQVHHAPLTDMPFHAAQASIFRHYWDPAWHFREQFELHPFEVPYVSLYVLGALVACVVPIAQAMKLVSIVAFVTLPLGVAVTLREQGKSPLGAVLAVALVWSSQTHWGFLNSVAATGLHVLVIGLALRVVNRDGRGRRVTLGAVFALVLFTHPFRFPFTLLALALLPVVVPRARTAWRALATCLAPGLGLFGAWYLVRPHVVSLSRKDLSFEPSRLKELPFQAFSGYAPETSTGREELFAAALWFSALIAWALVAGVLAWRESRRAGGAEPRPDALAETSGRPVTLYLLLVAGGHLLSFVTLPMLIDLWWNVYPREAVPFLLFVLCALPRLPRVTWARVGLVALSVVAAGNFGRIVTRDWARFAQLDREFIAIERHIPRAPKLFYLIYEHRGTHKLTSEFLHFPAWIQAERGGWLDFHFASWGFYPVRYRAGSPDVPPPLTPGFEWRPQDFRFATHTPWFDTFLVRHAEDPSVLFAPDPSIQLTAHEGTWWLYRRTGAPTPR